MQTIHFVVNTNVQIACNIFLCYINMLCLIANISPQHNKIVYSVNAHCTFIIAHSQISTPITMQ